MLRVISRNINRKNSDLFMFEIGKSYKENDGKDGYLETPVLCLGMTGALRRNWAEAERKSGFFDLKGVIENLMGQLGFSLVFLPGKVKGFLNPAKFRVGEKGDIAGFIGETEAAINREYDIDQKVYMAHIDLSYVLKSAVLDRKYEPIPRFPFSKRDISVICGKDRSAGELRKIMLSGGSGIVRGVEIVTQYEGAPIPPGKRSVSFSIEYGDPTRTLKDDEISKAHLKLRGLIAESPGVELR